MKKIFLVFWLSGFALIAIWKNLTLVIQKKALAGVFLNTPSQLNLEKPLKSSNCQVKGILPDGACTPGAIFEDAAIEKICVPGYTKTVRNVSTDLKKRIYANYAISYPQPRGSFEVDHLIPLALGGNNDPANLWPEAASPIPGFKEKDVVEIYLQEEVCAGRLNLKAAQIKIAEDWYQIYKNLSPEQIKTIKGKYKNWAN